MPAPEPTFGRTPSRKALLFVALLLATGLGGASLAARGDWLLGAGLLVVGLTVLAIHFALCSRQRSRAAEEAIQALRHSEERYEVAVRGSFQGLWDWDMLAGHMFYAPQCKLILGLDGDQPIDQLVAWTARIHPEDRERVMGAMDDHLARRTAFDEEFRLVVGPEPARWVRARGQAIWNDRGFPVRMAGSLTDISDRRQLQEELRQKVDELAASNATLRELAEAAQAATRAKSEFLANMSHEIRSPLTAVMGYTDLLLDQNPTADTRQWLERIHRNGEHLLAVLNDILDLSKIEAGRMELERTECPTVHLLRDVVDLMQVRAQGKGLQLALEFESRVPARLCTDPLRLRQILINLLGNAVKFTERGEVRMVVRASPGPPAMLAIDVVDTGIGLTSEQIARLFQPFVQADNSTSRRFGGTGLGLTISQRLALQLGGRISVASTAGAGSTFQLQLPLGAGEHEWTDAPTDLEPCLSV